MTFSGGRTSSDPPHDLIESCSDFRTLFIRGLSVKSFRPSNKFAHRCESEKNTFVDSILHTIRNQSHHRNTFLAKIMPIGFFTRHRISLCVCKVNETIFTNHYFTHTLAPCFRLCTYCAHFGFQVN